LGSLFVTEKKATTYLTVGRKPRYLTQGVTPPEKVAVQAVRSNELAPKRGSVGTPPNLLMTPLTRVMIKSCG
jgi:hypothetical protein